MPTACVFVLHNGVDDTVISLGGSGPTNDRDGDLILLVQRFLARLVIISAAHFELTHCVFVSLSAALFASTLSHSKGRFCDYTRVIQAR